MDESFLCGILRVAGIAGGAAFGGLFNDGKIDGIVCPTEGSPVLFRSAHPDQHHWVELKLMGGSAGPRDAVGATVYLNAIGMRQRQHTLHGASRCLAGDRP